MLVGQDRWGDFECVACFGDHFPGRRQQGKVKAASLAPEGEFGGKRTAIAVGRQEALGYVGGRLRPGSGGTVVEQAEQSGRHPRQHGENGEAPKEREVNPKIKPSHQLCAFANT